MALTSLKVNKQLNARSIEIPDGVGGYEIYSYGIVYSLDESYLELTDVHDRPYFVTATGDVPPPPDLTETHGVVWYEAEGSPSGSFGKDGDRYVESDSAGNVVALWRKEAGTWEDRTLLAGGAGATTAAAVSFAGNSYTSADDVEESLDELYARLATQTIAVYRVNPSGSASTDQANISAAITSANAETYGAVVYIAAGQYNNLVGGWDVGSKVHILGAGRGVTRLFHATAASGGADYMFRWNTATADTPHSISNMLIWGPGTSITDARGVVQENSYGFEMRNVEVSNYRGSGNSEGVEIHNSVTYSEGILMHGCRFTNNTKHIYAHKSGTGTDSLSDWDIYHCILMNKENMIGIHLDGVTPYASTWNFKGMNEMAVDGTQKATALYFTNTSGFRGFWNITWEGTTSTVGNSGWLIRTDGTHQIVADGKFINYDSSGQPATHNITSGSGYIRIDNTIGGRVSVGDANRTLDVNVDPYLVHFGTNMTADHSCSVFHNLRGLPRRFRVVRDEPVPSPYKLTVNMDTATPFVFPSYSKGWVDLQLSTSGWSIAGSYLERITDNNAASTPLVQDDFLDSPAANGWNKSGTGIITRQAATGNHPGIVNLDTGTTSGTACYIARSQAGTGFTANHNFDVTFIVKLNSNDTNTQMHVGLTSDETNPSGSVSAAMVQKLYADTSFFPVCRETSTQTRGTALVATDTSWHRIRIRRLTSTTVGFTIDSGTEQVLSTNTPTGGVTTFVHIINNAAASKSIQIDYTSLTVAGLSR